MFADDYKDQVNNITPDKYIKSKVLRQIQNNNHKPKNKYGKIIYRAAFAAAACFSLICSLWVMNGNNSGKIVTKSPISENISQIENDKNISSDASGNSTASRIKSDNGYEQIFSAIEKFKTNNDDEEKYTLASGTATLNGNKKSFAKSSAINEIDKASDNGSDFSETTKQVDGVDEADIVKTDGKYIYALSPLQRKIKIINVICESPKQCESINLNLNSVTENMYLADNRLVVIGYNDNCNSTSAEILDITNPESPKKLKSCQQSGYYNDSRLIGTKLYLITNYNVNTNDIKKETPSSFVPSVVCKNYNDTVSAKSICLIKNVDIPVYNVICGFDISDSTLCGTQSVLGGNSTVYCNKSNIITASADGSNTIINRFKIDNGNVTHKASGNIKGFLLNQFSIDEYKENFRFVTTVYGGIEQDNGKTVSYKMTQSNSLIILDKDLRQIGIIENIAPDERVYSVKFMEDIGYFVTFRQTDPLFSVDLKDPKSPKIIGTLKIPGFSNYLFPFGEGKLLGIGMDADENSGRPNGLKLSMFNISDPSNVTESDVTKIGASYSESLYNHKASLVDFNKNIIAFPAYDNSKSEYLIYSYENGKFINKATFEFDKAFENVRGMYIGKSFYVITDNQLIQCSLSNFEISNKMVIQ